MSDNVGYTAGVNEARKGADRRFFEKAHAMLV
jgi:hypothetical protein